MWDGWILKLDILNLHYFMLSIIVLFQISSFSVGRILSHIKLSRYTFGDNMKKDIN